DPGSIRGDLADRLLVLDLNRINDTDRLTREEVMSCYNRRKPRLLAGLLSTVARVLKILPTIKLNIKPRMADFARILLALDQACPELTGGRSLELYMKQTQRIANDVIDGDPVACAIVELIDECTEWAGTASDLLDSLNAVLTCTNNRTPRNWPQNPRAMTSALQRILPVLRKVGIEADRKRAANNNRSRVWSIRKVEESIVQTVQY
ncbi:MAG: hypothetical protein ACF8OB_14975, partial [Phycisphaeraceae bacterium JB051]